MSTRRPILLALSLALLAPSTATAARTWVAPETLTADGASAGAPQVAVDAAGNATAVWFRPEGALYRIEASTRPAGGVWQPTAYLSSLPEAAFDPQVAVNASGGAAAVWRSRTDGAYSIHAASRSAGGVWEPSLGISGLVARDPQVAIDAAGNATAVWIHSDGSNDIVEEATRAAGGNWQASHGLSAALKDAAAPQIAVDAAGNAIAIWQRFNGTNVLIQASTRAGATGVWQTPIDVSAVAKNASAPQVAIDAAGNATAVWLRPDSTNDLVEAATRPVGGVWQPAVAISATTHSAEVPQIAVDPAGDATAVWDRSDGSNKRIQASSRPVGSGAWQLPVDLSVSGADAVDPQVVVGAGGNATAIWDGVDGGHRTQSAARAGAGGAWQAPVDLSAPGGNAYAPQIALDAEGNAAAVWTRNNGSYDLLQTDGLDVSGPKLTGGTVIPATGVAGAVVSLSAAPLDVWSAIASTTWSFGDGSTAIGTAVSHVYGAAGTYAVAVTSTDAVGNVSTQSGQIIVTAPAPEAQPAPTPAPSLTPTPTPTPTPQSGTPIGKSKLQAHLRIPASVTGKILTLDLDLTPRKSTCPKAKGLTITVSAKSGKTTKRFSVQKRTLAIAKSAAGCTLTGVVVIKKAPAAAAVVSLTIHSSTTKTRTLTAIRP